MKNFLFLIMALSYSIVGAQSFKNSADINSVDTNGYYRIVLTSEITSQLNEDYSDIRLFNKEGKEVPYLLQEETPLQNHEFFKEYEVLENTSIPKKHTTLVLSNASQNKINNISLSIHNSEARKRARLTGSNDKESWYIIKENFLLESIENSNETSEIKIVDFPLSDYKYYKIEINDSTSEPLKINKAGYYDSYVEYGDFVKLPVFTISQKDSSNKISYVKLSLQNHQYIDRIKLYVQGPELYRRQANLCILETSKHGRYYNIIKEIEIRSNQDNLISLEHYKSKELYLLIENKDNEPLSIVKAEGYQTMNYLLAKLNASESYNLKFGDKALTAPSYDLEYFKNNLPATTGDIYPANFKLLDAVHPAATKDLFESKIWIWVAIIAVIILLGYMSNKMIKEMKNQKSI